MNGGVKYVAFIDKVHPFLKEQLTKKGIRCDDFTSADSETIFKSIDKYQGIVIRSRFPVDKSFLDRASQLKFIADILFFS